MVPKENFGYEYFHGVGSNYPKAGYETLHSQFKRFREIIDFVVRLKGHNIRWLDIGCAYGVLVKFANEAGIDAYGIDISDYAIGRGKSLYPKLSHKLYVGDCNSILTIFDEESFDVVTLLEILEHLSDPRQSLITISRVLKTHGYLLITTPLKESPFDADTTHVSVKPMKNWVMLLKELGFVVKAPFSFVDPQVYSSYSWIRFLTKNRVLADWYRSLRGKASLAYNSYRSLRGKASTSFIFAEKI